MKILVTGFDPFGGEAVNPASEAVKQLPNTIREAEIQKLMIPTVFHKSADVIHSAVEELRPDVVLCVGQAGGRFGVTPERIAINIDDARIPDNEKNQPIDEPIRTDGKSAYFTKLPVKAMVAAMRKRGVPASVSNSAGTFVCNHIMYQVLYMIEKEFPEMTGGFVHIPFIPEQVIGKPNQPSLNLSDIVKALEAGIEAIIEQNGQEDVREVGGTLH